MRHAPLILFIVTLLAVSFTVSQAVFCKPGNGGSKVAYTIVVDKSGNGKFKTIQAAIDSIPSNNNQWIKILVNPGIYTEQVTIPSNKPCIFLQGKDRRVTTITYDAHAQTDLSATFTSLPDNIVAYGITFKNSYNRKWVLINSYNGSKVASVIPALSARIYGDKSAFYECGFLGVQDTLWDVEGRHYFHNCYIEGAVDFIYGAGQSFYEDCSINVTSEGFITAQGRESPNDPSGFVFKRGIVSGIQGVKAQLGRAYRAYSRVIFQETYFSNVVDPQGWNAWHFIGKEGNFMYAEVNCKGPGSKKSGRVPWAKKSLDATQLQQFSRSSFIDQDGWLAKLPI